jgi:hypothetical protein
VWDYGNYFSRVHIQWMSWDGNCNAECAYQSFWFEWQDDYYYDLDSRTWVQQWNNVTQVAVNSTMFGNKLVCRGFNYYVDSLSSEVVELGTNTYPYKDLSAVFVELVNLHGGTTRNTTVFIKADTINYLYLRQNPIVGMSNITFTSYSEDGSSNSKATIIGTDNTTLTAAYVIPTMFNIMSNKTKLLSDLFTKIGGYSELVKGTVESEFSVFVFSSSNVTFLNMNCITSHKSVASRYYFFRLIKPKLGLFEVKNCFFKTSGIIAYTTEQIMLNIESITIDYYQTFRGFVIQMFYSPIDIYNDAVVNIKDVTVYQSKEYLWNNEIITHVLWIISGGNVFAQQIQASIYLGGIGVVFIAHMDSRWKMRDGVQPIIEISDFYFASPDPENRQYSNAPFWVAGTSDRLVDNTSVTVRNITIKDYIFGYQSVLYFEMGPYSDIHITDLVLENWKLFKSGVELAGARTTIFENFIFRNIQVSTYKFFKGSSANLILKNVTFENITSDYDISDIIQINYQNLVQIENSNFKNINAIFSGSVISAYSKISGVISLSNLNFEDIKLSLSSSLIQSDTIKASDINNIYFKNITRSLGGDYSNVMIKYEAISSKDEFNMTISNVKVESWTIPILSISKYTSQSTSDHFIRMSNITAIDWEFEFSWDLINIGQIQESNPFSIEIDTVTFKNLNFKNGGNLFLLQHQTNEDMTFSNGVFENITNSGITVKSFGLINGTYDTKIVFSNLTVTNVEAVSASFFSLYEGANIEIHDSKFSKISNVISGAVMTAGYQRAIANIYNSAFENNTSADGGVFSVSSESRINIYNSNFTNNFGIGSGVVKVENDGSFGFYSWYLYNNYAYYAPVTEVFTSSVQSIFDGTKIEGNRVMTKDEILNSFIAQGNFY